MVFTRIKIHSKLSLKTTFYAGIKIDFTGEAKTIFGPRTEDNSNEPSQEADPDVNRGHKEYCKVNYYLVGVSFLVFN